MENLTYWNSLTKRLPVYGLALIVPLLSNCASRSDSQPEARVTRNVSNSGIKPIRAEDFRKLDSKGILVYAANIWDAGSNVVEIGFDWVLKQFGVKRYQEHYNEELAQKEEEAIKELLKRVEEAKFSEAEDYRADYEPMLKSLTGFILLKRETLTVEEILPGVKKEFLRTPDGRKCGPVEKHVLDVFIYTFKQFDSKTSDENSGKMLQALSDSYELRMLMPVTYTHKDEALKNIAIDKLAEITHVDISSKRKVGDYENQLKNIIDKQMKRKFYFGNGVGE